MHASIVVPHNDLLVRMDRLIEWGFSGGELLYSRVRVMCRLGLA